MSVLWPSRQSELKRLDRVLREFSDKVYPLRGINDKEARKTLAMQMVASLRRMDYTRILKSRPIDAARADPTSPLFDPERAALLHAKLGNPDEAIWLIFLATHTGKHGRFGWRRMQDIYSGLGQHNWTWKEVSENPDDFRKWITANHDKIGGAFGNHRKYESLRPDSRAGTLAVIQSFVRAVDRSPEKWFRDLVRRGGNDPHTIFDAAYRELRIERFGRLARFDFLALLGRLDLVPMSPGSAYLDGATGPLRGGRLLIDGDLSSKRTAPDVDCILKSLDERLGVGMQVMEDSICNWQKSPSAFKHFKG
ncbi:hypothetical protein LRP30_42955 [Bradyrhizobium sp. C-145]|uniref:alpha-glutamyl/putrescinyl thymine pyrophosphorylase clade 3 protein n=1 Tax=Bradyrhizobium sp. C-145 TaxID=574727 RepID=UPI00201B4D45|nr:hypothetical protein [Bradyrhizobium sp. C-145]UQR63394.1 hypothetical protein LRP30_42955 [Bradyrhizobium sp. C-145]